MLKILSFGAGVQSTAILRMSLDGVLPMLDHVIFADPGAELAETYENVDILEAVCRQRGVGFHRVVNHYKRSSGNLFDDLLSEDRSARWASPPLFVKNGDDRPGQTLRHCTGDFKTDPINRKFRELCGVKPRSRGPKGVVAQQWLGIHAGEKTRMKLSQYRWFEVYHPLIESDVAPMNSWDCEQWLRRNGYPVPPKSACVFCPYQSDRRWLNLKRDHPKTFARCVELDSHSRALSAFKGDVYYHRSMKPLDEAVVEIESRDLAEPTLDLDHFSDECHGVCGV